MTKTRITYTVGDDEAKRMQHTLSRPQRTGQRGSLAIALFLLFVAQGVLRLARHDGSWWFGVVQIAAGTFYLITWSSSRVTTRRALVRGTRYDVSFEDAGISVDEPIRVRIPWSKITVVEDVGEAFVFSRKYVPLVILKRALPANGAVLWADLERRLVGRRNLVRGSSLRSKIVNTAEAT